MRTSLPIAVLLAALSFSIPAQAARWQTIGGKVSATKVRNEVDAASIASPGDGLVRLWHRETHPKPVIPDSGAFSFKRLTRLTEFQCGKRTAAVAQRIYTAADGKELSNEIFDTPEPLPVAPDSNLETVLNYACRVAKAKTAAPATTATTAPTATPAAAAAVATTPATAIPATAVPAAAAPVATPATAAEHKERPKKLKKGEAPPPPHVVHWSYTGATGADKWGSLDKAYETCGQGQRQSPIDIRRTVRADLPTIQFDYQPVALSIVDNGHSIKVDAPDGGTITVDGESYALQQFHFHRPSEEKINGKAYAMVAHLVHQSKAGKLAVVAVLFEPGKEQGLIRTLWTHLPLEQDKPVVRSDIKIDPSQLLPAKRGYYTFIGSLTTPPCSEGVLWLVLKNPIQASKEQFAGFATLYKNNVRPIQPVNGRLIKESR